MDNRSILISDARKFQRYGEHELAVQFLERAQKLCSYNEELADIEMLKSFSYRVLEEYETALWSINNAISIITDIGNHEKKYARYLMNKGIILECLEKDVDAISTYTEAIDIFRRMNNVDDEARRLLINALITISLLFEKKGIFSEAKNNLEEAKSLFRENEKEDIRYSSIINTLNSYENIMEGDL